jgi:hypothetical protein
VLDALLRGLPDEWTASNEGPDTFTPFDVVGHLIHSERTDWVVRARIILEHGPAVPFEPFDRFAQSEQSRGKRLPDLLDEFARLRAQNLETLRGLRLTDSDLERTGSHPTLGTVTLRQLLATWVAHDLSHVGQVVRVMAKQYRETVGPWRAYLPLLDR